MIGRRCNAQPLGSPRRRRIIDWLEIDAVLVEQQVARALAFLRVADHDRHNMSSSVFDPGCVKTCTIERPRKFPQLTAQAPDSEGTNPHDHAIIEGMQ